MNHIPVNFKYDIPKLYEQQDSNEMIAMALYYVPYSDWRFIVLEHSALQNLFYCWVEPENEYQYVTIEQLLSIAYDYDVDIILDTNFKPQPLKEVML